MPTPIDGHLMVFVFGLVSALLFGVGLVTQQHVVARTSEADRFSPRLLWDLARRPMWLVGIGAMVGGQVLETVALDKGSLTVVEPLLATSLLFALPIAAVWNHQRLGRRELEGAVALILGLTMFILSAGSGSLDRRDVSAGGWVTTGFAVVAVVAVLVLAAKRTDVGEEATLLGAAAGILYGLQDALTQRTVLFSGHGLFALLTDWKPYGLVLVGLAGLWLNQRAFAAAPLQASLPALTAAEPLAGIGIGAGLFGAAFRLSNPYLFFELMGLALVVAGVFVVARSPIVTGYEAAQVGVVVRELEDEADAGRGGC